MKFVESSKISGSYEPPISKSYAQRQIICNYLSGYDNSSLSSDSADDIAVAYNSLKKLEETYSEILLGDSGFCLRVIPVLASLCYDKSSFLISNRMKERFDINLFGQTGLKSQILDFDNQNKLLSVTGKLKAGRFELDGSVTSQILSGLIMSLPLLESDSIIYVNNLESKNYIDLTIGIIGKYSVKVFHDNYKVFHIPGKQKYKYVENYVEKDWSSATFILSAAAFASEIELQVSGLNLASSQPDRAILNIFDLADIKYTSIDDKIIVKNSKIKSFSYDFSDCPDLVPAIIPLTINSDDICILKGISRLKYKESNRIEALISEYKKCGIKIEHTDNTLIVHPGKFSGNIINTHNDHRIAMSLAVSTLSGVGKLSIENHQCVSKSYPNFWRDLTELGAKIYEQVW
ncbi:MAG: hypothetical protein KIT33_14370 [Candidatus Kapabacteria bacterium]|nr:hypothetical protein [Ignavibacteriota bacterium]MCW5886151.1 hypothetical protein [Candidatus Kapabacteria bacterium]